MVLQKSLPGATPKIRLMRSGSPPTHLIRRRVGLVVGPLIAVLVYFVMPDYLPEGAAEGFNVRSAAAVAAVAILMAVWWMTEALPIPVTALTPLILFPALGIAEIPEASAPYANKVIFLFMGGFMLAMAMQRWNLHRRMALTIVPLVGTQPKRLVLGFMIATAFLSMWVSNTATAVMMLPLGLSILQLLAKANGGVQDRKFATSLMLGIAYAATIGSFTTIISTPPNALLVAYMASEHGVHIGFGQWMLVGVPLAVIFLALTWWILTSVVFRTDMKEIPGGRQLIEDELKEMGPITGPEKKVLVIFVTTAVAWVVVPLIWPGSVITDEVIAVIMAVSLFIVPADWRKGVQLLDWESAKGLPWGVLLLFGGGLTLAQQVSQSGLGAWIGGHVASMSSLPVLLLVIVVALLTLLLTELMSNTATAATLLPIIGGAAVGLGVDPLLLAIPVALTATCCFMLPAATPPNAVAFSSGYVQITDMIRGGVLVALVGVVLITVTVFTLAAWVFGIAF